ncbi:MAG: type II secretion system protein GspF [Gammaproteobacteria bacterium]|nr:MAG: type II secretion system protein GspF [Gammaproteobacteria bacterium]RKZ38675.1 MAG: type II secretion system protein GspF [Gammaproteobacteria bacterium]RKZ71646.1 MAG: type II secretion system protein GspF [Gammaproteobacteria bacterium]
MAAFEYTALDKTGRTRKGVLEGDTARQIRQQLREQNLTPLSINEVVRQITQRQPRRISISATDLALLTRQLATLVHSGLALEEALRAISEQSEKARLKSLLLAVRSRVLEGHSLAEGLGDFPNVFPSVYRATVAAGEESGHLDLILERLAEYTENRQYLRQKTLLALFYPALLSLVAISVVIGLLAYVVPQVVQVFGHIHQELPRLTRALITLSEFLQDWGIWLLLVLIMVIGGIRYSLRFNQPLMLFHRFLLFIPLVSRLERGMNVARFTRTLSILTESGVPMLEALRITAQVVSNYPLRQAILEATNKVREGSSLHTALAQSGLFPPMTLHLIMSGESSGKLESMLERAAIMQERELETLMGVLLGLFEPLLILVMGGIVLTIVLAILMPIFELNQLVR